MTELTVEQIKEHFDIQLPLNLLWVRYKNKYKNKMFNVDTAHAVRTDGLHTYPYGLSQKFGGNAWKYSKLGLRGHNGLDFATGGFNAPVYAAFEGTIESGVDPLGFGGNYTDLWSYEKEIDGKLVKLRAPHYHLKGFTKMFGRVTKGEKFALSDNSGTFSTGPHLHFGIKVYYEYANGYKLPDNGYNGCIDPLPLMPYKYVDGDLMDRFDGSYVMRSEDKGQVYFVNGYTIEHVTFDPPRAFRRAIQQLTDDKVLTGVNENIWDKIKNALI